MIKILGITRVYVIRRECKKKLYLNFIWLLPFEFLFYLFFLYWLQYEVVCYMDSWGQLLIEDKLLQRLWDKIIYLIDTIPLTQYKIHSGNINVSRTDRGISWKRSFISDIIFRFRTLSRSKLLASNTEDRETWWWTLILALPHLES